MFGLKIVFSESAMETTSIRTFPESKNRSKRILKKLVKRFGGEFRKKPCMMKVGNTIFCHPNLRRDLERAMQN